MPELLTFCGRTFNRAELELMRQIAREFSGLGVTEIARTVCEFFREPDAQLGFLWGGATMGQLLSIPLFLAGVAFIVYAMKHPPLTRR